MSGDIRKTLDHCAKNYYDTDLKVKYRLPPTLVAKNTNFVVAYDYRDIEEGNYGWRYFRMREYATEFAELVECGYLVRDLHAEAGYHRNGNRGRFYRRAEDVQRVRTIQTKMIEALEHLDEET